MVGDVYSIQWWYSVGDKACVCRLHCVETEQCNSWIPAQAVANAQILIFPLPIVWIPTNVKYDRVYVRRVFPSPGPTGETYPGTTGNLPLQDAAIPSAPMVINLKAAYQTPYRQGRIYWSGYAEEDQLQGQFDTNVVSNYQLFLDRLVQEFQYVNPDISGKWRYCLFRPEWEKGFPISHATIRPNTGSMRTRRRRAQFNVP